MTQCNQTSGFCSMPLGFKFFFFIFNLLSSCKPNLSLILHKHVKVKLE